MIFNSNIDLIDLYLHDELPENVRIVRVPKSAGTCRVALPNPGDYVTIPIYTFVNGSEKKRLGASDKHNIIVVAG